MEIIEEPQKKKYMPKKNKKEKKLKKLLNQIINSDCKINIGKCDNEGDIIFEVPMKSVGITYDILIDYKKEISSKFVANFLGEYLVRENIEEFAKIITGLKDEYIEAVNKYMHAGFGIKIYRDKFILKFNVSLIQKILMEDFEKQIV
jgi:hypothetical protein